MRRLALLLFASPAAADCSPGETLFTCQAGQKVLEICHEAGTLIYSFGPAGAPELLLAEPLATANFQPWPGVGSSIWESLTFFNQGYAYEVTTSVSRDPGSDQGLQGAVFVLKGDRMVGEVACDPGTASNALDVVWTLKEAIGQCWDFGTQSWQTTCGD